MSEKLNELKIDGIVEVNVSTDEFTDKFIEWIESNGWFYCGITGVYCENNDDPKKPDEDNDHLCNGCAYNRKYGPDPKQCSTCMQWVDGYLTAVNYENKYLRN